MLHEERTDLDVESPSELAASYRQELASVVEEHGREAVADESSVDGELLDALLAGEDPDLSLTDAAAIQAVGTDLDAETIEIEAREHVLLGMSMAVLDVDTLAAEYEGEHSAKAIQQRLEGRAPTSLAEFARIEYAVVSRR